MTTPDIETLGQPSDGQLFTVYADDYCEEITAYVYALTHEEAHAILTEHWAGNGTIGYDQWFVNEAGDGVYL